MTQALEILGLPFVRSALAAGVMVSLTCSYLGVFVVLRRTVFVGIAMAQLAALGVALSLYIPWPPEALALVTTLAGALVLGSTAGGRHIPRDAFIGFVYVASVATGTLLVAKSAQGESHVLGLLFGNILTVDGAHLLILLGVTVGIALVQGLFFKEFLFSSYDPETARASGLRVGRWNLLFDLSLAVTIAAALHEAGALLVFSMLVQPALTGLLVSSRLRRVMAIAVASGLVATVLGLVLSVLWDLPTGPAIVAVSSLFVTGAWLARRLGPART